MWRIQHLLGFWRDRAALSKAALGLVRLQNVLAFKPMMKGVNYSLAIYAVALTYPLYPIVTTK
jgi:hypothetical protein